MYDYEAQAEYLTKNPQDIEIHWNIGKGMFKHLGNPMSRFDATIVPGCLTQIRERTVFGAFIKGEYNSDLTETIQKDERIPTSKHAITPDDFPVFIEFQKRFDSLQNEN